MASVNYQQRNTQAVKVVLSELYATWATSDGGLLEIHKALEEIMTAVQSKRKSSGSRDASIDSRNASHFSTPVQDQQQHQRVVEVYNTHYADPNSATVQHSPSRSVSPPPSPPGLLRRRGAEDGSRTPSPVLTPRFFSVDELDHLHRASSPCASPASPSVALHSKPVVDPMAPVPHFNGSNSGTNSPPATHLISTPGADVAFSISPLSADVFPPKDSNMGGSWAQSQRYIHSFGSFALMPPANVQRATVADIPTFYSMLERKGRQRTVRAEEEDALRNYFAIKGSSVNRKVVSGLMLPIDTTKTVRKNLFGKISQEVFSVPSWMKDALFRRIAAASGNPESPSLTYEQISSYYYNVFGPLSVNRRLFELVRTDVRVEYLTMQDFKEVMRYLVDSHPGLEFLKQPEFQEYYCRTVAIRIMYELDRYHSGRIGWCDFDRSDLPEVMREVDEKDVNLVLRYFSYEHFYVLYCKFWELDTDRDQLIGLDDLCKYGQGSICTSVLKRVVEGKGRRLSSGEPGRLDFEDFVFFCLSEEDKNSSPAVCYWFRVLDTDGDGLLSGYELYEFYQENHKRFLEYSENPEGDLAYGDMMCQMMDMLGFSSLTDGRLGVTLSDLRACSTPSNFFNMIFNAPKFMLFEHRDPFSEHQQKLRTEKTDWDRFARAEYDRMASEAQ